MKAFKTASGKWRCRPVDHYEVVNGKRRAVLASITRDTRQEALQAAYNYQADRENERIRGLTVQAALDKYVELKKAVISPTTYKSYVTLKTHAYTSIASLPLSDVTSAILQAWVSEYSTGHAPKSVANAHGLLMAVMSMFRPDARFSVRLPQKKPPKLRLPTDEEIKILLDYTKGSDLEKAILLSAFGTFRRGEVCALTYEDVTPEGVTITKSLVKVSGNVWELKAPKTPESVRTVKLPPEVVERVLQGVAPSERIIKIHPSQVSDRFTAALKKCGIPHCRFHDLRAYAVSIRHALGVPDQYIMKDGGYKTDAVMKATYRRAMEDKREEFTEIANAHFSALLQ